MTPAPRVLPPPPRNVRFKASYIAQRRGFAVSAILIGLLLLLFVHGIAQRTSALVDRGVMVEATVRSREHVGGRSSHDEVVLDFNIKGRRDWVNAHVGEWDHLDLRSGATTNLWIDPDDTQNYKLSRPTREDAAEELLHLLLFWAAGGLAVWVCFWIERADATKHLNILRDYEEAAFNVVSIHVTPSGKTTTVTADGTYVDQLGNKNTLNGLVVTGTIHVADTILILYEPDQKSDVRTFGSITRVEVV